MFANIEKLSCYSGWKEFVETIRFGGIMIDKQVIKKVVDSCHNHVVNCFPYFIALRIGDEYYIAAEYNYCELRYRDWLPRMACHAEQKVIKEFLSGRAGKEDVHDY